MNAYSHTYDQRWSDGDPTSVENLDIAREGVDHVKKALDLAGINGDGDVIKFRTFDGVVGSGLEYSTIQAADDDLDSGAYTLWVKSGSYAGFTVSTNNAKIYLEPGTTITSAITLSGDNITLRIGAGSDIQGLLTLSGQGVSVICENGVGIDGFVMSGNACVFDGGGWDTVVDGGTTRHAANVSAVRCFIQNAQLKTTPGGGQAYYPILLTGAHGFNLCNCLIDGSDGQGINGNTGANITDCFIFGNSILSTDDVGMEVRPDRWRIIGNYFYATGAYAIDGVSNGDNTVFIGNIVQDPSTAPMNIRSGNDNWVAVGNRLDGTPTDGSGNSTVADNDETSF